MLERKASKLISSVRKPSRYTEPSVIIHLSKARVRLLCIGLLAKKKNQVIKLPFRSQFYRLL